MSTRSFSVLAAAAVFAVAACNPKPADRITASGIMTDVEVLSADSMQGRAPATVGEQRATDYIAKRFADLGLQPVGDSYILPVELVGMTKDAGRSSLTLRGPHGALPLEQDANFTYWSTAERPTVDLRNAPVVFVGYGVEAPEYGWDDFKGQDVRGKVLLFLNDDPQVEEDGQALFGGPTRTYYGRWTYKFEQAQKHGAAGAIIVHTTTSASYGFSVIGNTGSRQVWQRTYRLPMLAWMDSTLSERVASSMGTDLAGLFARAQRRDFRPVDTGYRLSAHIVTQIERAEARNVAGVVPGSDPALADQYVVFTAHHDHLGMKADLPGDDKIYNGAQDNALGVASIIAAAQAFAAAPARRPVMFVSVTAEEGGLLGSSAFVANPPVPLHQIVADFNVDSPQLFGVTRDVAAIGIDMGTLGDVFTRVAEEHGLEAKGDPNPSAGSFYRSDQVSFAKAGIPALYLQAGTDYVQPLDFDPREYHQDRYHQVTDEIGPAWDLSGTERDMRLLYETAWRVANDDAQPRWAPGNEFEQEWNALYKPLVIDTHVDIEDDFAAAVNPCSETARQVDLPKMEQGGVDAVFFVVYVGQGPRTPEGYAQAQQTALDRFAAIHRMAENLCPDRIQIAYTPDDLVRIHEAGKKVAVIGMENGYIIGKDLSLLKRYYDLGGRYLTLSHMGHNDISDSANPRDGEPASEHGGLSPFGEQVVHELNRLGIMVDVSHISGEAVLDAVRVSSAPVIASHSAMQALADIPRNLGDAQLEAIAANGGVVQVVGLANFVKLPGAEKTAAIDALRKDLGLTDYAAWRTMTDAQRAEYRSRMADIEQRWPRGNVSDLVDHIDHAVQVMGIDHVGIASDFDGGGGIDGWNSAAETPAVTAELVKRGYTTGDIRKLWGGNLLRVWRAVASEAGAS
ncbi:MAG TPA: M20/M25/M40 family metallo-hydrolase [Longimicrobiales bacterium]|nr:M20/M25/M40 family metallo-hydrolase [Longimicrobiales bacterium]